jgi:hypothetical protein
VIELLSDFGSRIADTLPLIDALKGDPRYTSSAHPEHRLAVAEMARLVKIVTVLERDQR